MFMTQVQVTLSHGGSWIKLANNSDIPTVPTNVSDFTNDAGYVTKHICQQ